MMIKDQVPADSDLTSHRAAKRCTQAATAILAAQLACACARRPTPSEATLTRDGNVTIVDIQGSDLTFSDVGEFADSVVQLAGPWSLSRDRDAYGGICAWAYASTPHQPNTRGGDLALAYISPVLLRAGRYSVELRWCDPGVELDDDLEVRVHAKAGEVYQWTRVDQQLGAGEWHNLGTFYLKEEGEVTVSNWDGPVALDAVRFTYLDGLRAPATSPVEMPPPPMATATPRQ